MSKLKLINFTSVPSLNKYDLIYFRYAMMHSIPIGLEIITISNSIFAADSLTLIYSFRNDFIGKIYVIFGGFHDCEHVLYKLRLNQILNDVSQVIHSLVSDDRGV